MEKQIKNVVESLAAAIDADDRARYEGVVDAIAARYPPEKGLTPERFSTFVSYDIGEKLVRQAAMRYFPEIATNHHLSILVEHYGLFDVILKELMVRANGTRACSADYSRWILRAYETFCRTGELPDMTSDKGLKPDFGTAEEWMTLCDGIAELHYGNAMNFLLSYALLLDTAGKKKRQPLDGQKEP